MPRLFPLLASLLVCVAARPASASDGGADARVDARVDAGHLCEAVGGQCIAAADMFECGTSLAGLPCAGGETCCIPSSAYVDGAVTYDAVACLAVSSACSPGDSCCAGANCAPYGADGSLVCGYPPSDDGGSVDAGLVDASSCVARSAACSAADVCCGGGTCGAYGADGAHVCGPKAMPDASAARDAGAPRPEAASAGGCSCDVAGRTGTSPYVPAVVAGLLLCSGLRRRRRT